MSGGRSTARRLERPRAEPGNLVRLAEEDEDGSAVVVSPLVVARVPLDGEVDAAEVLGDRLVLGRGRERVLGVPPRSEVGAGAGPKRVGGAAEHGAHRVWERRPRLAHEPSRVGGTLGTREREAREVGRGVRRLRTGRPARDEQSDDEEDRAGRHESNGAVRSRPREGGAA